MSSTITYMLSDAELLALDSRRVDGESLNQVARRLALEAAGWMGAQEIRDLLREQPGWFSIAELVDEWGDDPRDRAGRHRAARRALYLSMERGEVERRQCDKPARSERGDGVPSRWEWRWVGG